MASRNIKDCTSYLQHVWSVAEKEWALQYPHLPQPFLTCTYRPNEEQAKLYAQGRSTPGPIVTWAAPGESRHNKKPSTAFDIAFKTKENKLDWSPDLFKKFAAIVKPMGNIEWGGDWPMKKMDRPHFQEARA